ncbi:hypothetical protein [Mesorhizobium sp. AA23]|uniref:DUF6946 family protein n=1 Tax=Mesorhizobium sp. AA23 TaxID=1854058 RepID=UPI000801685C|nr:hypothetical protein [Mesorhizobium sp. AA23]OBQ97490.1 hypothetical protein A9K66_03440 [Mesorhizobium sp. AA23]
MSRIYIPSTGPDNWQALLADPSKHWRTGYSARTLAHCWERANGLPPEIAAMFDGPSELLLALPEHKVPLAGGQRHSQSDVFALIRFGENTCAATIEGKVNEPFGPTVGEWFADPSDGKRLRLRQICDLMALDGVPPMDIRYQLLHRTASALLEAKRFKTDEAAMIVHTFSAARMWFDDFERFAGLFGNTARPDEPMVLVLRTGQRLRLGWATGNPEHLLL